MKTATLLFLLSISSLAYSQDFYKQKIEELQKAAIQLQNEINAKIDSLNSIKMEIKYLEDQQYLFKFNINGDSTMIAITRIDARLRESASPGSKIITNIKKNDTIIIDLTDYESGYWFVKSGDYVGYLQEVYIIETDELRIVKENLIKKAEQENEDHLKKIRENDKLATEKYHQEILKKYGKVTGQKLIDGYYWIGMTDKMARISLGSPNDINRTVGSWGVHEQWVYSSIYLYFENGVLTSYQN